MSFDRFKKIFEAECEIYDFIDTAEAKEKGTEPFAWQLVDNLDTIAHDSYGSEDSTLQRIFYIKDFDIYVKFWGNRSSYQGEEWYGYKEVTKTTKIISTWD